MKTFFLLSVLLMVDYCFGQKDHKLSVLASFRVNKTFYDRTLSNNAGGFGVASQWSINTRSFFKPLLELDADAFGGTKELYVTPDDKPIYAKSEVYGIYIGTMVRPLQKLYITTAPGLSFFNGSAFFGIRPSVAYYFGSKERWAGKISFTNIFQRDEISNKSFGYASFAIGLRIW